MKKQSFLFIFILSVLLWSCGGGSENNTTTDETLVTEETPALDTKEAMMDKLAELNITIPEGLEFESLKNEQIKFKAENVSDSLKQQFDESYSLICSGLKAAGWNESEEMENNKNLGGIIKQAYRYKKPIGTTNFKEIIIISTDYFEDSGKYQLNISYFPKY